MRRHLVWLVVSALALIAAGCAKSDEANTADGGSQGGLVVSTTTTSTTVPARTGEPVTVTVAAGDYDFHSSLTTFVVGVPYHFEVTNVGTVAHEFMLLEPVAAGAMTMEDMDAMATGHIEEDALPAGATATVDVTFDRPYPAGTLEMACHIGQHYEKGMRLAMSVAP